MATLGEVTGAVLGDIDGKVGAFARASFEALTDPVSSLMTMLLVLALLHLSLSVAMGWTAATMSGVLRLILRYAFIWGLIASWPAFNTWFYAVVTGTPDDVVAIIVAATGIDPDATGISAIIERFIDAGISIGDALIENVSISTIPLMLIGVIILFLMLVVAAGVILVIGISKIGIGVLTATAPIFLALLLFSGTKGFFDGWLRLMTGFAITYLMAMVMLGFLLFVTEDTIQRFAAVEEVNSVAEITEYLLIVILSIFLLRQIPSFGSGIAGSASIGIDGIREVMQNSYGAYNRAHGLRGDGRKNYAAENRQHQRQRLADWGKAQVQRLKTSGDTPAKARSDAQATARKASAVEAARRDAKPFLKGGEPSRKNWNKGVH